MVPRSGSSPFARRGGPATIGCDVGGSSIKFARVEGGRVVERAETETPRGITGEAFAALIAESIAELAPSGRPPPRGACVALPGRLAPDRRSIVHLSSQPQLDGYPIAARIEEAAGMPVLLEADVNAAAYGEYLLGAGRGCDRMLYLGLGTGVGAAFLAGGIPARSSYHVAGHAAHVPIPGERVRCPCGGRGCAEAVLSSRAVARRAGLRGARAGSLEAARLARGGDRRALTAWRRTGGALGRLLATLSALFLPERIVIGGGVSLAADLFLADASRELERLRGRSAPPLRPAELGRFAGAIGAAYMAQEFDRRESAGP